jgi:hypothetical protein
MTDKDHEIIYLQNEDDVINDDYGRTWCVDDINEADTKYIRYDLYAALQTKLTEQDKLLQGLATGIEIAIMSKGDLAEHEINGMKKYLAQYATYKAGRE